MADATPTGTPEPTGTPPVSPVEAEIKAAAAEALPHARAFKAAADQHAAKLAAATTDAEKLTLGEAYTAELNKLNGEVAKLSTPGQHMVKHFTASNFANLTNYEATLAKEAEEAAKSVVGAMKAGLEEKHYKSAISYVKKHGDALKTFKAEKEAAGKDEQKIADATKKYNDALGKITISDTKVKTAYEHLTEEAHLPKVLEALANQHNFNKYHGGAIGIAVGAAGLAAAALLPGQKEANPDDPSTSEKKGLSKGTKWCIAGASAAVAIGAALISSHTSLKPLRKALESVYKTAETARA